jgi:hypothetical protein
MIFVVDICIPWIDLSNNVSYASNGDRMEKLRPREADVLTCPNGSHMTFGASSPRVRFLDVYGF